jgi:hypothetical protein
VSKTSGIGERLYVNAFDLSGDVGALGTIGDSRNQQETPALKNTSMARIPLLRDATLGYSGYFSTDAAGLQATIRALPQDALFTWATGIAHGSPTGSLRANTSDFTETRGPDGALAVDATGMTEGTGMEWGVLLMDPDTTLASAGDITGLDDGYKAAFVDSASAPGAALPLPSVKGLAAYLHVISLGSGSATVHVQHSTDDVTYADLIAFTAATGATSQRSATASDASVDQYLRVHVTGTFTNLKAAVAASRGI